jgi:hypothetical protein
LATSACICRVQNFVLTFPRRRSAHHRRQSRRQVQVRGPFGHDMLQ